MSLVEEQQPPDPKATGPDCWELVFADMQERREYGMREYGTPLRPDNLRDPLLDAYQEALDLVVYLRTEIERRKSG